jgi:Ca2+-binding EF-hand superfamily protein
MEVPVPRRIARLSTLAGLSTLSVLALPVPANAQAVPASPGAAAASQPLTRARLSEQLDANFKALDTNGDKALNAAEIEAAQQKSVAQTKAAIGQRLDAEFAKLDSNKDGQLSLTEFKAAAPTPRVAPATELLGQFDRNKDGKVAADEYRATPLANFDRIDTNKDGTVSAEEQAAAAKQR